MNVMSTINNDVNLLLFLLITIDKYILISLNIQQLYVIDIKRNILTHVLI